METPLWMDGPVLHQQAGVFPLGTDSIVLADFVCPGKGDRILDLGAGGGALSVLLGWQRPDLMITALEIDSAACSLARKNLQENRIRAELVEGDLRHYRTLLPAGSYDLTVSNPPYFCQNRGKVSELLSSARSDQGCSLNDLCSAAAWATRWGGRFCLVFRPERLSEIFSALEAAGFAVKRIRPVHHSLDRSVNLFLIEARRGGNPGITWEKDLYLCELDGSTTPEAARIYHRIKE